MAAVDFPGRLITTDDIALLSGAPVRATADKKGHLVTADAIALLSGTPVRFTADKKGHIVTTDSTALLAIAEPSRSVTDRAGHIIGVTGSADGVADFFGHLLKVPFQDNPEPIRVIRPLFITGKRVTQSATTDAVQLASMGLGTVPTGDGLRIYTTAVGAKGLVVRGSSGQTANLVEIQDDGGTVKVSVDDAGNLTIAGAINHDGSTLGLFSTAPVTKQTVTGSRSTSAAVTSLLTALAAYGAIVDSTSA